jgi:hypothetical protein
MNQDDAKIYVSLADFVLQQDVMLIALSKLVLVRFQGLEDTRRIRAHLEQMPDSGEKIATAERLSDLERTIDFSAQTRSLKDLLAARESVHEKLEAVVTTLRASFPPDSGQRLT